MSAYVSGVRPRVFCHAATLPNGSHVAAQMLVDLYGLTPEHRPYLVHDPRQLVGWDVRDTDVHLYPRENGDYHRLLAVAGEQTRWGKRRFAEEIAAAFDVPIGIVTAPMYTYSEVSFDVDLTKAGEEFFARYAPRRP